jgi:hypothetical protein
VRIPTLILEERTTMTNATMALAELAEKGPPGFDTKCSFFAAFLSRCQ